MTEETIVALIAFAGTIIGSGGGILASSKLTNHRLKQLENKVDKHNCLVERVYKIEGELVTIDEKFKVINHRITDLKIEIEGKEE